MGRLRCVYIDGKPLPGVFVIPLRGCRLARVVVVIHGEYRAFALKEEALEFLKQKLGADFEIKPCRE
jgi:hypothetical protein